VNPRKHAAEGGSSGIKALYEVTPLEGIKNKVADKIEIKWSQGYKKTTRNVRVVLISVADRNRSN